MEKKLSSAESGGISARNGASDISKGILMLAVVISHAWFAKGDILGDYFAYSMPAFFFLSGFSYKPGRSYVSSIGKRAKGLLIPYLVFSVIWTLLYPLYVKLSGMMGKADLITVITTLISGSNAMLKGQWAGVWLAVLKCDSLNMLMSTPMWFLGALFTASIVFYALVDKTRDSALLTGIAVIVLLGITVGIEAIKKDRLPWFVDLCPYAVACMLLGAFCGCKKLFSAFKWRDIIIGAVLLVVSFFLNKSFWGSARTSMVQYIEGDALWGVFTAFVIAITGSVGLLAFSELLDRIPGISHVLKLVGKNTLWILCTHYTVIMLLELVLYNKKVLTNSIVQIVSYQIYGYGAVHDFTSDKVWKTAVALFSVCIGLFYAYLHKRVKKAISAKRKNAA